MSDMVERIADILIADHVRLMNEVKSLRREPVGLELYEIDAIIDDNITITDSKLRDAVYAVALDIMHTVLDKNGLLPE